MVRRRLGPCGFAAVSPIGLGTTKLGRNTDVKYPERFSLPTEHEINVLLESAAHLGVNLLDTAPAYGVSEERLGSFVQSHRNQLVLCTKCGEQYGNGRSSYDFSRNAIIASVEQSLRRLRTDRIDLLFLHSDGRDLEILTQTDALETLSNLKQSGKILAAGISAKTESGVLVGARSLDVIMAPFSEREPGLGAALATVHRQGVGIVAIKALLSGHLDARSAIAYVLRQSFIDCLVLGTINPAHLETAVAIAEEVRGK